MARRGVSEIVEAMETGSEIDFSDLVKVCDHYFGAARQNGTSHRIYKTPWPGDPRVNIQDDRGKAKRYQVRQVLKAIAKINEGRAE